MTGSEIGNHHGTDLHVVKPYDANVLRHSVSKLPQHIHQKDSRPVIRAHENLRQLLQVPHPLRDNRHIFFQHIRFHIPEQGIFHCIQQSCLHGSVFHHCSHSLHISQITLLNAEGIVKIPEKTDFPVTVPDQMAGGQKSPAPVVCQDAVHRIAVSSAVHHDHRNPITAERLDPVFLHRPHYNDSRYLLILDTGRDPVRLIREMDDDIIPKPVRLPLDSIYDPGIKMHVLKIYLAYQDTDMFAGKGFIVLVGLIQIPCLISQP